MADKDRDEFAEDYARSLKKFEKAQANYLEAFNDVCSALLKHQESLGERWQQELAECAKVQPGSCS
ncbi:hypothetical protein CO659_06230 [Rhizobium sp. S9]|uniref:hypothetical protein n=1 Tax=unclassified Rhizobium TaxID=2613769 RepID=UPI000A20FE26|nr:MULTISPECIES: hypothetical protein [unclassified Rhizobium]ARO27478.1 hypothetical protein TAL182_PD00386 [Rhizobium sp. TAL182]PDS99171.1 hypothetical protein CO659_06230 [Rhizobium sp. S9]